MNSSELLAKEALAMAERELNARDYAHYPQEYVTIIRALALAYQEQAAELKDRISMAERLNALIMRHNPQAWGRDLVTATQEYIAELLRRHRADNDVFYRMVIDGHVIGLSLADIQEMRKKRFEEIVKEGGE